MTQNLLTAVKTITPAAPEVGDFFLLTFSRDGNNAGDTVNSTVNVLGWLASYTADS